jgi:hypothetical protein
VSFSSQLKAATKGELPNSGLILTPRIEAWYRSRAGASGFGAETIVEIGKQMASTTNSSRASRFGASAAGTCPRAQMLSFAGFDSVVPPDLSAIFADGHWRHLKWQAMGLEAGWFEEVEHVATLPDWHLKVSLDAVNWSEGWFFELKGTSQFAQIQKAGPPHKHLLQIHRCMLATGLDTCVYVAEDKRLQGFAEVVVRRDEALMAEAEAELEMLTAHVDAGTLPALLPGCVERSGPDYRGCLYKTICHDAEWTGG